MSAAPLFLIFSLYGPFSAWGGVAVGETRSSWNRPTRSAILGIVAGSLGLARDDPLQQALETGYGVAVRVDSPGRTLRDFHTVQTVAEAEVQALRKRADGPLTRARTLASAKDRHTVMSRRDYRVDALYLIALWARDRSPYPLSALALALSRPQFAPYLGRRSCPPSLPFAPVVVTAPGLAAALASYSQPRLVDAGALGTTGFRPLLCCDDDPPGVPPPPPDRVELRPDGSLDRARRLFVGRPERVSGCE